MLLEKKAVLEKKITVSEDLRFSFFLFLVLWLESSGVEWEEEGGLTLLTKVVFPVPPSPT